MPERLWLSQLDEQGWRDAGVLLNPYILRSALPSMGMLYKEDWQNSAQFGDTLLLDRVILFDREAARQQMGKTMANGLLEQLALLEGPKDWWEPIRQSVVAGAIGGRGGMAPPGLPVVTYVSRQHAEKRRCKAEQHEELLRGLEQLANERLVEVNVVEWETMSRQNQIAIASRTTVSTY